MILSPPAIHTKIPRFLAIQGKFGSSTSLVISSRHRKPSGLKRALRYQSVALRRLVGVLKLTCETDRTQKGQRRIGFCPLFPPLGYYRLDLYCYETLYHGYRVAAASVFVLGSGLGGWWCSWGPIADTLPDLPELAILAHLSSSNRANIGRSRGGGLPELPRAAASVSVPSGSGPTDS